MGSACCVAARERTILSNRSSGNALPWNVRHSPSWSCQWDNQGHVEGEAENTTTQYSSGISGNFSLETKGGREEFGDLSGGGSPLNNSRISTRQQSPSHKVAIGDSTTPVADLSMGSSFSTEVKELTTSAAAGPSASMPSFSTPVTSALSIPKAEHFPSHSHSVPADATPSRKARRSPGHQLFRQISSGRIPGLKSPNNSASEGRHSSVLSAWSNDVTVGSQGGSLDGWSMGAFSELVASSRRERWSFDSESLDSARGKVTRSTSLLTSPSVDLQTCGVCSKLLTDRSPWMGQKLVLSNELLVVAVLVCGHVYHAECLENVTPETEKFDPSCPLCMTGDKQPLKMSSKTFRMEADFKSRNRIARNRVVDSNLDEDFVVPDQWKNTGRMGKIPKMAPTSSTRNSFAKPFLKRHFSLGSRSTKSILEAESSDRAPSRKGFWARYRKE